MNTAQARLHLSFGDSFPKPLRRALFTAGTGACLLGLFAYLVYKRVRMFGISLVLGGWFLDV